MIAHSLDHPGFGLASKMHGATYIVDAAFETLHLNEMNVAIDIGLAADILHQVLQPLHYQNLDELPDFKGKITTTEYLAFYIHSRVAAHVLLNFTGKLTITLGESHIAWASYANEIGK